MRRAGVVLVPALVGLGLLATAALLADPLPERSARVVSYDIAVELLAETHELVGRQRVVWRNPSTDEVADLWWHLYLNAFRNSQSTFYRESGGKLRSDEMPVDGWGWIDVTAMRLADGTDLLPALTFEQPDDGNREDRTVARVPLPAAVPPGGEVTVDVQFRAQLPKVFARTGYAGDFHLVGQWFPKLGVYEPAGLRGRASGGWNCHQFHANSEFYADYGSFRVAITAPERFVVGATGQRVEVRAGGPGQRVHVYQQDDVHDFAWTADPRYLEVDAVFSATDDVPAAAYAAAAQRLGRSAEEVRLSDVAIRLLLQPEHQRLAARYLDAAKLTLREMGLAFGRYPYPTVTIVDPPRHAPGATGMEYPTFVTGEATMAMGWWPLSGLRWVELVTVHELGHQFWYGLVGSNEFEEAWLDEGLTTWSTARTLAAGYGEHGAIVLPGARLAIGDVDRAQNHLARRFDAIRTPAWGFSRGQYGFNSYARPALVLRSLEGMLGGVTMARVMRTYAERHRFGHPSSEDFYAVVAEVSGRDLRGFFAQVVESPGVFDPAVVRLTSEEELPPRGRLLRDGVEVDVSEEEARAAAEDAEPAWRSKVELRQLGEAALPVEVELRFADAPAERWTWDGARRWERLELVRPTRLETVVIDPDGVYALDANQLDSSRRREADARTAVLGSVRGLSWIQHLLALVGL